MNTKYQPLSWNEKLLTGVAEIDEQHRMLINMLNEANRCLTARNKHNRLENLIRDLMSYALYHFETEEALMLKHHYDPRQQAQHVDEHRSFSEKIAGFHRALSQNKPVTPEELLNYLSGWLHNHILTSDKELALFLSTILTLSS